MRTGALVAAVAALVACGLAVAPPAGDGRAGPPGGFWNRSQLLGAAPLLGVAPLGGPALPLGESRAVPSSGETPAARGAVTALRVGALFERDASGAHFCTASVVDSPGQDLLVTAAHCLNGGNGAGYKSDIVFIPDYRDGAAPYGIWAVQRMLVAPQWAASADPDYDVGFVVLQPHDGLNIEQVLGANRLGYDTASSYLVRVTGYPSSSGSPITCRNWTTRHSATQLEFDCDGYTDGTSGSPWVTGFDPASRTGTIVGVIGGYQDGGDTASVSYSSYFGRAVQQLYQQAAALGSGTGG